MEKSDRQNGGREQVVAGREPQRARPAPGKVTRTSKLSPNYGPAIQRKVTAPTPGNAAPQPRSLGDFTMDAWMDAAHRGVTALSDPSQRSAAGSTTQQASAGAAVSDAPPDSTTATETTPHLSATASAQAQNGAEAVAPAPAAGPEAGFPGSETEPVTDAPTSRFIIPFDRNPLAAPGERIIFHAQFTDPSPADYQLEFSTTGGHFNTAAGATSVTKAGLASGNVDFFVPSPWDGRAAVQVVLKLKKVSDGSVVQTETWNFGLKAYYPTTMTQQEGTGKRNLPAVYQYQVGPARPSGTAPFYEHQTILEKFGNWTLANITPADIDPAYRTTHSLSSPAAISQHFLGNYAGHNGTFTVNGSDRIADQHGGHPNLANLVSHLVAPKEIEVALPQVYEAQPGSTLGSYTVTRVLEADGTTWKVKKG